MYVVVTRFVGVRRSSWVPRRGADGDPALVPHHVLGGQPIVLDRVVEFLIGFGDRFAHLPGDEAGNFLLPFGEDARRMVQDPRAGYPLRLIYQVPPRATVMAAPLIPDEKSLTRNETTPVTSPGSSTRPAG